MMNRIITDAQTKVYVTKNPGVNDVKAADPVLALPSLVAATRKHFPGSIDLHRLKSMLRNGKRAEKVRMTGHRMPSRIFRNDQGFSLTEIVAALAVSTILIILAALAIITFFTKFKELSYFADLQQQAFEAIETMKYGYPLQDVDGYVFMGISNAKTATLEALAGGWGAYSGIYCVPDRSALGHANDYIRFYWDRNSKSIRMQALYGVRFYQEQIFPKVGDDRIEVTFFNLTSHTGTPDTRVLKMELTAEVIISEEKRKEVSYTTTIALGR